MSEKKNGSEIHLIQLNSYIRPTLQENKSKNWVLNGTKKYNACIALQR